MNTSQKLSLNTAILININMMLGSGIFVNTAILAQRSGILGSLGYVLIGLFMLPMVLSMAQLLIIHPGGNFYTFAKEHLSPGFGFLNAWSYFIAKLSTATITVHIAVKLLQQLIPLLGTVSPFLLDGIILTTFVGLNMFDMKTGSIIQLAFIVFKSIPILFGILVGAYLFNPGIVTELPLDWGSIPSILPLVMYATIGFEAACSLSSKIENPEKNAPRAIIISYAIVVCIAALYQFFFFGAVGPSLVNPSSDYRDAFPSLVHAFLPTSLALGNFFVGIMHLGIAASVLGSSYAVLFSNNWNLHDLARKKLVPFSSLFAQINRYGIPYACVILEGLFCAFYLFITQGTVVYLQQLSSLGISFAYALSAFSLLMAKKPGIPRIIPFLATCACLTLVGASAYSFFVAGINTLIMYICLVTAGLVFYAYRRAMGKTAQ
jgi:amino acid transporter